MSRLRTSVIVCTYTADRMPLLREAIAAVYDQEPPCDEVVIVVDHNPELARTLTAAYPDAVVIENAGPPGLSAARNTGVRAAGGDVVVFLDDDAVPRGGWLQHLVSPFADPAIAATGGCAVARWEIGARPAWFPEELDWVVGCSFRGQQAGDVRNPIGCSMAFRASVLRDVGGFSTELGRVGTLPVGCEETEIGLRVNHAGGRIVLVNESVVDHFVPRERSTVGYVLRRCYAEGLSKAVVRRLAARSGTRAGALGPEQRYAFTMAAAMARSLWHAVATRSAGGAARALLIPAALISAGAGFLRGGLTRSRGGGP